MNISGTLKCVLKYFREKAIMPWMREYLILPDDKCYLLLSTSASEAECFSAMEKCIWAVRAWMIQDKMKLSDDETEFLIIGTSQ